MSPLDRPQPELNALQIDGQIILSFAKQKNTSRGDHTAAAVRVSSKIDQALRSLSAGAAGVNGGVTDGNSARAGAS
jgi:hypothetical protein